MSRRLLTILGLFVVVAMLATACGTTATPTSAPTSAPTKPAATAAATKAPSGGTFTFCLQGDAIRLDPSDIGDEISWLPIEHIFEPLYVVKDPSGTPSPALATSYEVSSDLKVWTFHLRQGVKFQDGTPFNADSYMWTINRQWDPANKYHADQYSTQKYTNFIDYWGMGTKGDPKAGLQDFKKIDDYTIQFVLKDPNPLFLHYTHTINWEAISPASFDKWGVDAYMHPVGTGPYIFQEWVKEDHITLVKNPDYWDKGVFNVDKIVFKSVPDAAARILAVKAGECQATLGVSPDDAAAAAKDPTLQVAMKPPANVGYIAFNQNIKPLDNKNLRLALAYAIDKKSLVDNLYKGLGQVATQWEGPLYNRNPAITGYPFDLAKAKEYLTAAGYPNGLTLDFWYMPVARPYMPQPKALAEAVSATWAKIGVNTNLKTEDWGQYISDWMGGAPDKMAVYLAGNTPDFLDPKMLDWFFKDEPLGSGFPTKMWGFSNQQVNDLLTQGAQTIDVAARTKIYNQVEALLYDLVPGVPFVNTSVPDLFSAKVKGFVPVPLQADVLRNVTLVP